MAAVMETRTIGDVVLKADEVTVTFGAVKALTGVSFDVKEREILAIIGPNGAGKTTMLNMIGGLTRPSQGQISIGDQEITEMSDKDLAQLRLERIGFVFQSYNLLPVLTALENAEFTLLLSGIPKDERRKRVLELFNKIGLSGLEDRKPGKLSGGQQQRVAVARAVVANPALILADEPTANLDSKASADLLDVMERLNQPHGTTFLFSTHDPRVMERSRRLITLVDGQIESDERRNHLSVSS